MAEADISEGTRKILEENNVPMDGMTSSELRQLDGEVNGDNVGE